MTVKHGEREIQLGRKAPRRADQGGDHIQKLKRIPLAIRTRLTLDKLVFTLALV